MNFFETAQCNLEKKLRISSALSLTRKRSSEPGSGAMESLGNTREWSRPLMMAFIGLALISWFASAVFFFGRSFGCVKRCSTLSVPTNPDVPVPQLQYLSSPLSTFPGRGASTAKRDTPHCRAVTHCEREDVDPGTRTAAGRAKCRPSNCFRVRKKSAISACADYLSDEIRRSDYLAGPKPGEIVSSSCGVRRD
jgi:hypothetical protein